MAGNSSAYLFLVSGVEGASGLHEPVASKPAATRSCNESSGFLPLVITPQRVLTSGDQYCPQQLVVAVGFEVTTGRRDPMTEKSAEALWVENFPELPGCMSAEVAWGLNREINDVRRSLGRASQVVRTWLEDQNVRLDVETWSPRRGLRVLLWLLINFTSVAEMLMKRGLDDKVLEELVDLLNVAVERGLWSGVEQAEGWQASMHHPFPTYLGFCHEENQQRYEKLLSGLVDRIAERNRSEDDATVLFLRMEVCGNLGAASAWGWPKSVHALKAAAKLFREAAGYSGDTDAESWLNVKVRLFEEVIRFFERD